MFCTQKQTVLCVANGIIHSKPRFDSLFLFYLHYLHFSLIKFDSSSNFIRFLCTLFWLFCVSAHAKHQTGKNIRKHKWNLLQIKCYFFFQVDRNLFNLFSSLRLDVFPFTLPLCGRLIGSFVLRFVFSSNFFLIFFSKWINFNLPKQT